MHAALDLVDIAAKNTSASYLKIIDKFNEMYVSAYVLPSGLRFMLLHDASNTDGIRNFFTLVHELYVKISANPFQLANQPLVNSAFDARVRMVAKKWL